MRYDNDGSHDLWVFGPSRPPSGGAAGTLDIIAALRANPEALRTVHEALWPGALSSYEERDEALRRAETAERERDEEPAEASTAAEAPWTADLAALEARIVERVARTLDKGGNTMLAAELRRKP